MYTAALFADATTAALPKNPLNGNSPTSEATPIAVGMNMFSVLGGILHLAHVLLLAVCLYHRACTHEQKRLVECLCDKQHHCRNNRSGSKCNKHEPEVLYCGVCKNPFYVELAKRICNPKNAVISAECEQQIEQMIRNEKRQQHCNKKNPALTIVEECRNADTGVGPFIASGSHSWNGNCADFVKAASIIKYKCYAHHAALGQSAAAVSAKLNVW